MSNDLVIQEQIEKKIYLIRGKKVMLDRDLAELYEVETRVLNQSVKRNIERFPEDFMISLSREEIKNLSQFVISSKIKHAPKVYAFTEHGHDTNRTSRNRSQPWSWHTHWSEAMLVPTRSPVPG